MDEAKESMQGGPAAAVGTPVVAPVRHPHTSPAREGP